MSGYDPMHGHDPNYCDDVDDGYPYDEEDNDPSELEFDCHIDARGNCGKAGSEECDFECPYRNVKRN